MNKIIAFLILNVIGFVLFIGLPVGRSSAQSSYDVEKSKDTANVPYQPPKESEKQSPPETKTIMVPTWPIQVPVRVPKSTEERPENPHAGENEGAREGLGGRR